MLRKIIFLLLLAVVGVLVYNYLYQDHRDISSEKPDFIVDSVGMVDEFSVESKISELKYIDKTIQVSGVITEINDSDLTLDDAVFCQLTNETLNNLELGQKIKLKGRCIGFDDLLEQVKLNECTIIK